MTKTVEVLDALMGSGKTHAIIKYMSENQGKPWLYISPMLDEVDNRVPAQADSLGMELFTPYEDDLYTKSQTCLTALTEGKNICCTHNLMYKFTAEHLKFIRAQDYIVVSDEELNLINGYNISREDTDFLVNNNIIKIEEDTGKVVFLDSDMSIKARYGDIKSKADLGMIYAAKRSYNFMVTQISPMIIDAASRFILLTYNYKDSLMQTFLELHNYQYKEFNEVTLYKTNDEIRQDLLNRIEFLELKQVRKIQDNFTLSKSWWMSVDKNKRKEISSCIRTCVRNAGKHKDDLFYTGPKDYVVPSKGFETKYIGSEPRQDDDGIPIESTRTFIACNARSTNKYADKTLAVHAYNLYPNQSVKAFIQGRGYKVNDDVFALNMLLQWLFRGCIRKKGEDKLQVAILSKRMSTLFKEWLMSNNKPTR